MSEHCCGCNGMAMSGCHMLPCPGLLVPVSGECGHPPEGVVTLLDLPGHFGIGGLEISWCRCGALYYGDGWNAPTGLAGREGCRCHLGSEGPCGPDCPCKCHQPTPPESSGPSRIGYGCTHCGWAWISSLAASAFAHEAQLIHNKDRYCRMSVEALARCEAEINGD